MKEKIHTQKELMSKLPKPLLGDLDQIIHAAKKSRVDTIIVLDDDPTGTQTVYDIPVLTTWSSDDIRAELERKTPLFFILTNSRSLIEKEAMQLAEIIGQNIREAAEDLDKKCLVISRSDSTLRGHYPAEVRALEQGLGLKNGVHFIIPAFFEGGRYTIQNVHYVQKGEQMIPAAQTPFAQDKVFGYRSSNLREWIAEKTGGDIASDRIKSLSLRELRNASMPDLIAKINKFKPGDICIVNAADYPDLKQAAIAILHSTIHPVFRTAASFVAALAAQASKAYLTAVDFSTSTANGGLIIVGSYVPKSTQQLAHLQKNLRVESIEIDVAQLLGGTISDTSLIAKTISDQLENSKDVVLSTSRQLQSGTTPEENLAIGEKVSNYLTEIVANLSAPPKYILAKGGITSSVIATRSLGAKRAIVQGQIIAGVPVWQLGEESKFPGLPYIVFPGNVGEDQSMSQVVEILV